MEENLNLNDKKTDTDKLEGLTHTEKRMATEKLSTLVLKYSIPTIISMLVSGLYNVIDRFWVGKIPDIGANALAGIGVCMPLMNVAIAFSMLVGIGAASRMSISIGARDKEGAEKILGNALIMITFFGIVLTILGLIFLEPLLRITGATDSILPYALDYMQIVVAGSLSAYLTFSINHPIRAMGNSKRFAFTQIVGAVTNIVLDPLFILVFKMGIRGAAYATVIAQLVSCVLVFSFYFSKKSDYKFRLKNLKIDGKVAMAIISIGISPFLMQIAGSLISTILNRSLIHYGALELGNGDIAIGAMTAISSLFMLLFMPILGINQGVQPIIGFNFGAKNYMRVRDSYLWSTVYSVIICVIGFILIQFFAGEAVKLFNDEAMLVEVGSKGLRLYTSSLPIIGFLVPTTNFFQAIGRANISIILNLLRQVFLLIPAILVIPMIFGLNGVFLAMPFADYIICIICAIFIIREFKLLKVNLA